MAWVRCMGGNTAKLAGTDKVPYLNRAIPFSANLEKDKLVGGTVAFNQLSNNTTDNTVGANTASTFVVQQFNAIAGHKYMFGIEQKDTQSSNERNTMMCTWHDGTRAYELTTTNANLSKGVRKWVSVASDSGNATFYYWCQGANVDTTFTNYQVFDLTAMFGTTIADHIYSLEQGTAGAGVAFFRSLFPEDYYAYNAGELMSVKTSAHKTYDSNNVLIGEYPLDSNLELRGIAKLDSNNKLYYDGDTYEADGTVTRKYGIVDLGSLTWEYSDNKYFRTPLDIGTPFTIGGSSNFVCAKYTYGDARNIFSETIDKVMCVNTTYLYGTTKGVCVRDTAYTDAATFNAAMSGVYLIYELATPTTETADSFINPQAIEAGGTEEYVDSRSVAIPVGHESKYYDVVFPE